MRAFILSSLIFPALTLVSAHQHQQGLGQHHRHERSPHHVRAQLAERQRSTGTGVLDGILGDGDDDDGGPSSTTRASSSTTLSVRISSTLSSSSSLITSTPTLAPTTSALPSVRVSSSATDSGIAVTNSTVVGNSSIAANSSVASATSAIVNLTSSIQSSTRAQSSATPSTTWSVDAAGQTVVVTEFQTLAAPSATTAPSETSSAAAKSTESPGISTAAIVGICVAVGVVLLSLVGCAIWRMKRRGGDEDEAIRWPELNRHGDSDAHHALPARETGKHGFETNPLERSLSNSSSIFAASMAPSGYTGHGGPAPMALNGSNFGAASSLDHGDAEHEKDNAGDYAHGYGFEHEYDEKHLAPSHGLGEDEHISPIGTYPASIGALTGTGYNHLDEDYTSFPPVVQMQATPSNGGAGGLMYDSESDEGGRAIPMAQVRRGSGPYRL